MAGEKPKEPWTGQTLAKFIDRAPHLLVQVNGQWQLDRDRFPGCNTYNPGSGCAEASGRAHARRLTERLVNDPSYPWVVGKDEDGRVIVRATHSSSLQARVDVELRTSREASRANLIRWALPGQGGANALTSGTALGSGSVPIAATATMRTPAVPDQESAAYVIASDSGQKP
ncbi:hypothetical protein [Geminicoccus harenae]|uniref:hypothetical protein n=1 Tax=Geminicoccus harenae TaxID=2498453 RepID=UPI00168B590C|nr:hypothetical protein [Geminicoccus harenae]